MSVNFSNRFWRGSSSAAAADAMPNLWRMMGGCFGGCPVSSESKTTDSHHSSVEVIRLLIWFFFLISMIQTCSPFPLPHLRVITSCIWSRDGSSLSTGNVVGAVDRRRGRSLHYRLVIFPDPNFLSIYCCTNWNPLGSSALTLCSFELVRSVNLWIDHSKLETIGMSNSREECFISVYSVLCQNNFQAYFSSPVKMWFYFSPRVKLREWQWQKNVMTLR